MADAKHQNFPWAREQIAKYQALTAEAFQQGQFHKPAQPGAADLAASFVRHAAHTMWSLPAHGAETMLNWLDFANRGPSVVGQDQFGPGEVLAPTGVGMTLRGFAKPNTVGVFGGRVAAENLEKAGRPTAREALDMAERIDREMSAAGKSRNEIREEVRSQTNEFIAKNDPRLGGVDRDAYGKYRFELDDAMMLDHSGGQWKGRPRDVVTHPEGAAAYPTAGKTPLEFTDLLHAGGVFHRNTWTGRASIQIERTGRLSQRENLLVHEYQHLLQHIEKRGGGWSPGEAAKWFKDRDPVAVYESVAGEVEARLATRRRMLTPAERRENHPVTGPAQYAEDVARKDQRLNHPGTQTSFQQKAPDGLWLRPAANPMGSKKDGFEVREYDIMRGDKRVGPLEVSWGEGQEVMPGSRLRKTDLWVDWLEDETHGFHGLGNAGTKQVREALKELHPWATHWGGERVGGAKVGGAGKMSWNDGVETWQRLKGSPELEAQLVGKGFKIRQRDRTVTEQPGEGGRTKFDVLENGKRIGTVEVSWGKEFQAALGPNDIWIAKIDTVGGANTIGTKQLLKLARELKGQFPWATRVGGERVSGARTGGKVLWEQDGTDMWLPLGSRPPTELKSRTGIPIPDARQEKTPPAPDPDVWIDEDGVLNIGIRPQRDSLAPIIRSGVNDGAAADQHIGRNAARRVEVVKVDDSTEIQSVTVQGLDDEFYDLPLRGQAFGHTGVPPVGSVGYLVNGNGRPDQAFLMGLEHPDHRPRNQEAGEVTAYGIAGQTTKLNAAGDVVISTPNGEFHTNPPGGP